MNKEYDKLEQNFSTGCGKDCGKEFPTGMDKPKIMFTQEKFWNIDMPVEKAAEID